MLSELLTFRSFCTLLKISQNTRIHKRGSSATSPQSSVMSSTGSLYSTKSATKSPYWLGIVFTASTRPILVMFAFRWLQSLDEQFCIQRRVAILWSLEYKKNWAGERSFRISAPTVWNLLHDSLKHLATSCKHFRKELKTYLFRKSLCTTLWELLKSELTYLLTITMIIYSTHTPCTPSLQPSLSPLNHLHSAYRFSHTFQSVVHPWCCG